MANTFNLNLEEINANDTIKTDFIEKLNNNMSKIDDAFGLLKLKLMNKTQKTNLNDAIDEFVSAEDARIEMERMASIGDAEANDIAQGKIALVQGQQVTGTRTALKDVKMQTGTITGTSSYTADSITFAFDKDVTNARIIYYASPVSSNFGVYYSTAKYTLISYDSNYPTEFNTIYHPSRDYYGYVYKVSSGFTVTKEGNTVTITGSSQYNVSAYTGNINARCIAILE